MHASYFSAGYALGLLVLFIGVLAPLGVIISRNRKVFVL